MWILTGIFVSVMLWGRDVEIAFHKEEMQIDTYMLGTRTLSYDTITEVSYRDNLDVGKRTSGVGSFRIQAGNYKNEELGSYRLYSYAKCKEYIVCDTVNGWVVMNGETQEETEMLYEKICGVLSGK